MYLIADSGSTKTSWRLIGDDQVFEAETHGLNPYYQSFEQIRDEINLNLLSQLDNNALRVERIFFYGAGCSSIANKNILQYAIEFSFPDVKIAIEHDLMGAARSLCGMEPGIACILGTGSNSCEYDGNIITRNIPSLGYVLGDEGSGSHFGRLMLSDFLRNDIPADVKSLIESSFRINKDIVLERIYQKQHGNRYLASFVPFIKKHIEHPYFRDLVYKSFKDFFDKYLMLYDGAKNLPVSFTGSISYHLQDVLKEVSKDYGIHLNKIEANPVNGLISYHK